MTTRSPRRRLNARRRNPAHLTSPNDERRQAGSQSLNAAERAKAKKLAWQPKIALESIDSDALAALESRLKTRVTRVLIFVRVSSAQQKSDGHLERQKGRLRQLAKRRGWIVVGVVQRVDRARRADRPQMHELAAKAIQKKADFVLVTKWDRLMRHPEYHHSDRPYVVPTIVEWRRLAAIFRKAGAPIFSEAPADATPSQLKDFDGRTGRTKRSRPGHCKRRRDSYKEQIISLVDDGKSYREVEAIMLEDDVHIDHSTIGRWCNDRDAVLQR